jgi:hypothetical protein
LFGLDNLRKFGCSIDLEDSKLHFRTPEEFALPFLSGHQIKEDVASTVLLNKKRNSKSTMKDTLWELMSSGFTRLQVIKALTTTKGNKEHALKYLRRG